MKNLALVIVALALLAGLFLWLRPAPAVPPAAPAGTTASALPAAATAPVVQVFDLKIKDGKLLSGPERIEVQQGDTLTLRITSDHADELHLHGYDLTLALPAGQAAELRLVADRSGRFEYELHHAHQGLGALEVLPR